MRLEAFGMMNLQVVCAPALYASKSVAHSGAQLPFADAEWLALSWYPYRHDVDAFVWSCFPEWLVACPSTRLAQVRMWEPFFPFAQVALALEFHPCWQPLMST